MCTPSSNYQADLARGREIEKAESAALIVKLREQLTKALEDNSRLRTQLDSARKGTAVYAPPI